MVRAVDARTVPKRVADRLVRRSSHGGPDEATRSQLFCKHLEWTADGTSLISTLSNNKIQTIVVPANLLDGADVPHQLEVYCSIASPEPVKVVAGFPRFDLQDPPTTILLSAPRDLPVRLSSALTGAKLASYPLINPMTEEYISPYALDFTSDGSHFAVGSESLISVFDLSRPGQEPLFSCPTGPKRRAMTNNPSTSMRGIVSALDLEPSSNILAAGTLSRQVALYDAGGQGECLGAFTVAGNKADEAIGGRGITQVLWSQCGRYLHIAERMSSGVMVYDIRQTGQLLSWLHGREAITNQRLGIDLCGSERDGQEIWAGGTDGTIKRWKNAHHFEGPVSLDWECSAHAGHIPSAVVHPLGDVLATCSGQRKTDVDPLDKEVLHGAEGNQQHRISIWELSSPGSDASLGH